MSFSLSILVMKFFCFWFFLLHACTPYTHLFSEYAPTNDVRAPFFNGINAKNAFFAQTKGRRERERERQRKGKEKGKRRLEVKLWQKRKKSQTTMPGIEPGNQANAANALPLSHPEERHHQPVFSKFILSASTSQHRHYPIPTPD